MRTKIFFWLKSTVISGLLSLIIPTEMVAQHDGITRTELQRHDLQDSLYLTIQARIDFEPNSFFGMHSHPGEEVIYVLSGILEYEIEGSARVILESGEVLFIPAGQNHSARNTSENSASELATYILEKGKPLLKMKE